MAELVLVIIPRFGVRRLGEVTSKIVRQFQQDRLDTPANKGKEKTALRQPATVNREMAVLSRIFSLAIKDGVIEDNPCRKANAKACENAKLVGFRFYDLRHTFGTHLAEAGERLHRIAELMGHTDIQMTMRYVQAVATGKHEAVERLVSYAEKNRCKIVAEAKEQAR